MAEEKKEKEKETPTVPSTEDKPDQPEAGQENIDYIAKLKELEETLVKRLDGFGFGLRKIQDKMKEEGWEIGEEGLTEEKVRGVVAEALKPFQEALEKQGLDNLEILRAAGKPKPTTGADAGQKPEVKNEAPPLSEADKKLVEGYKLHWDATKIDPDTGKKGVWIGPSGKIHAF